MSIYERPNMKIQSKLPDTGLTIFSVMTNLANAHQAINLSQGFPDFDVPAELIDLTQKYMRAGYNQYAPMQGVQVLRERIAAKAKNLYQADYDPATEITITSGATEALFAAIAATVQPGDEVVLLEPAFDAYEPAIILNGGIPVYLQLKFPGYRIDWEEVRNSITAKTRLLILNTPHNPTGAVLSQTDIAALKEIVAETHILILSDEVYEHIIFDGLQHESMARYPELAARSFVVSSFGKTYHATGWKIGYCLAPRHLSQEFQKVHQFLTFASNTPIQYALAEFLHQEDVYLKLSAFYQARRDKFVTLIQASRFKSLPCHGTYFQMLDYSDISGASDVEFAKKLTTAHGVAAIPPSAFYHTGEDNRVVRFCFAKKEETLRQAAQRLVEI